MRCNCWIGLVEAKWTVKGWVVGLGPCRMMAKCNRAVGKVGYGGSCAMVMVVDRGWMNERGGVTPHTGQAAAAHEGGNKTQLHPQRRDSRDYTCPNTPDCRDAE